jgi:hypothetical protein
VTKRALLLIALLTGCPDESDDNPTPMDASDSGTVADSGSDPDAGMQEDAGDMDTGTSDGGFVPPAYDTWVKFEPPGAVCANGSPYKFFVKFSRTSSDVVIFLEGGGACWDYASCTGTGIRSAANRDGLADNHATAHANIGGIDIPVDVIYPLLNQRPEVNPMSDWNKIFIPYCTGDVYSGDTTVTYQDPSGAGPPVEFHHRGHANILRSIEMLSGMFEQIPRMFVSGCSAGGAGAIINYYFFRTGLNVDRGYLFDDSGPIFPDTATSSWSRPLHDRVRMSWNVDPLIESAPMPAEVQADFGNLPRVLALEFPDDRLAHTHFRSDYNYSLYSYERFYEVDEGGMIVPYGDGSGLGGLGLTETVAADRAAVYRMWRDDTELLREQFDAVDNLAYFMPFFRETNSSHCLTIPGFGEFPEDEVLNIFLNDFPRLAWEGTSLMTPAGPIDVRDYVDHLLDDAAPLESWFEEEPEGRFQSCHPDFYDQMTCEEAHR